MNGPQHYIEAERLISESIDFKGLHEDAPTAAEIAFALSAARVHATLALAAATAACARGARDMTTEAAWDQAVSS